jgi:hypothetical protein
MVLNYVVGILSSFLSLSINTLIIIIIIIIIIITIIAIQPFVGPWTLFQFLDLIHSP